MTNPTLASRVVSPDATDVIRHGGPVSLKSTESSQSTPELRDPDVDNAWNLGSLHVFHQPRRIPKVIQAHVVHEPRPVRDEASTVTKGDLTMSSSTSRSPTLRSIAEEQERIYATDNADEGVAPSSKKCLDRICLSKLAPSWRRRETDGASVKRRTSLRRLMKSKRDPDYQSVVDVDVTDFQKRDAAASTQTETESRASNNVESEHTLQERYISSKTLADKYPDPTSDSWGWEEFDGGSRCWFQSCKLWPPPEEAAVPEIQRRDRTSTSEKRDEPASSKALTQTPATTAEASRPLKVFPRTTPFIVKEKERLTTFDEAPLTVRKEDPSSPARSHQSSASASTQGSSYFIIDQKDFQLASRELPARRTVANQFIESHDDDDDETVFILEVGLD